MFLNGCLIHSHCRGQTSVALSSMEAEILAATGLLTEAIYVKQLLQFLIGDAGGLGNQNYVLMKLRIDSTSPGILFSSWSWESKTFINPSTLDTTSYAKAMVLD